jgi:hypothetical protein
VELGSTSEFHCVYTSARYPACPRDDQAVTLVGIFQITDKQPKPRNLDPRMEMVRITLMDAALRVTPEFFKEEDSVSLHAVPYTACGRMMDSIPNSEPQVSPNEKINTTHSHNRKKLYDAALLLCAGVRLLATRTITLRPISKFDRSPE